MTQHIALDQTPRRVPGLSVAGEGDEAALVDESGRRVALLNEPAAALWDLCDGQTTVREMVDACVELFGADPDQMCTDVTSAVQDMAEAKLLLP